MFVWASYAGGLRISDLLLLKWENFNGTHIHFTIKKTNQQHTLKLPSKALEIIKKLKLNNTNNRYLFGMLPEDLDESNP